LPPPQLAKVPVSSLFWTCPQDSIRMIACFRPSSYPLLTWFSTDVVTSHVLSSLYRVPMVPIVTVASPSYAARREVRMNDLSRNAVSNFQLDPNAA
jgi:hypothetical protein